MGNPLRNKDPNIYRLITIRTEGAHFWLRPSKDINRIVGGVLARYCEIFDIIVYAYIFISNHYHLLIRCPRANADEFQENLNRELARRLNWKNHRSGKFWGRRYSEQEVLTEDDLLEAFLYITTNGVKHGLEANPAHWPGLSSYKQNISEKALVYPFYHYSAAAIEERVTYHTLKVTPLPQFENLSKEQRVCIIKNLIVERANFLNVERKSEGKGFLGAEKVKSQNPNSIPEEASRSPRPSCYTKNPDLRRKFREGARVLRRIYSEASSRFRLGDYSVQFPEYTFRPPLHRKPRILPFQTLPDDHFKNAA